MTFKLALASLSVLGLLSGFVLAILLVISYLGGNIPLQMMIGITIAFNLIMWLFSPIISDLLYRFVYGVKFYTVEELLDKKYILALKKSCDRHKVKYPKIGIIDDMNPTAFTYGSTKNNARIVFTKGLENYLDDNEIEAVLLHELGHIVHNDFIVMTIASTILQVLYEIYAVTIRASSFGKKSDSNDKGGAYWIVVAIVSYVFYIIGTYLVLFLSRIREYYADSFSAKETKNPNALSTALLKIAYGILNVPKSKSSSRLLNSTRSLGIFDIKSAKDTGLIYSSTKSNKDVLTKAMLFDIFNPWAGLLELNSTHPLIGKRIRKLDRISSNPLLNIDPFKKKISKIRMWKNFLVDILITKIPGLVFLLGLVFIISDVLLNTGFSFLSFIFLGIYAVLAIFRFSYMYSVRKFVSTTTVDLLCDVYASPVRGKPVELSGKVVGRGIPGLILSEDMIYEDKEGIIYLNYESKIPFIGNMLFGVKDHKELHGVKSEVRGWFFRGSMHHIDLKDYSSDSRKFKSAVRFWAGFWTVVKILGFAAIVILI